MDQGHFDVRLPELGMSSPEVDISEWRVGIGDHVERTEPLVDVEAEKATVTIEAPVSGYVAEIVVGNGASTKAGDIICRIRPDQASD